MTGLKHYLGPFEAYAQGVMADTPFHEDEPRPDAPNFYYAQEDELFAAARRAGFNWSVHRSHTVFGFAVGNAMNMVLTLARVRDDLQGARAGRSSSPARETQWNGVTDVTDADLLADQIIWAPRTTPGRNEAFNIANGDVFRWRWLWPQIAAHFGLELGGLRGPSRAPWSTAMAGMEGVWKDIAAGTAWSSPTCRPGRLLVAHRRRPRPGHRGAHRHEQEPDGRLHRAPGTPAPASSTTSSATGRRGSSPDPRAGGADAARPRPLTASRRARRAP